MKLNQKFLSLALASSLILAACGKDNKAAENKDKKDGKNEPVKAESVFGTWSVTLPEKAEGLKQVATITVEEKLVSATNTCTYKATVVKVAAKAKAEVTDKQIKILEKARDRKPIDVEAEDGEEENCEIDFKVETMTYVVKDGKLTLNSESGKDKITFNRVK